MHNRYSALRINCKLNLDFEHLKLSTCSSCMCVARLVVDNFAVVYMTSIISKHNNKIINDEPAGQRTYNMQLQKERTIK